jgi:hypothetical protein
MRYRPLGQRAPAVSAAGVVGAGGNNLGARAARPPPGSRLSWRQVGLTDVADLAALDATVTPRRTRRLKPPPPFGKSGNPRN